MVLGRALATMVVVLLASVILMWGFGKAGEGAGALIHGPADTFVTHETYNQTDNTKILSDNVVKFMSDNKLMSDNTNEVKLFSDNPKTTTNRTTNNTTNNNGSPEPVDVPVACLLLAGMVVLGAVAVSSRG